jgi:hypothetical protein
MFTALIVLMLATSVGVLALCSKSDRDHWRFWE